MKQFQFLDFNQDLLTIAVKENYEENIIFITPTHYSKKELNKIYQSYYGIKDVAFFTMDEAKKHLFVSDMPLIKEDKRKIFLYSVLTANDKKFFHITDYFSSIKFAGDFFKFFSELNEGLLSQKDIYHVFENSLSDTEKQNETFGKVLNIRKRYLKKLKEYHINDEIFLYKKTNFHPPENINKIVVINQFYFTELEKFIIDSFKDAKIYLQMPKDLYDKNSMKLSYDFNASHLKNIITQKINFTVAKDITSMYIKMLSDLPNESSVIIDFEEFPLLDLVNRNILSEKPYFFKSTSLYDFLLVTYELISTTKNDLISLDSLSKAWQSEVFAPYFCSDNKLIKNFSTIIFDLNKQGYNFIDYDLLYSLKYNENILEIYDVIFNYIKQFTGINTITDLTKLFYDIIKIDLIEKDYYFTNIGEVFYQTLYDLKTADFYLKEIYKKVFEKENKGQQYLKLLLEHLKYKKIKKETTKSKHFITSLLDTRNVTHQNIFILNMNSGKLPSSPKSSFILTEMQKKQLGLLTYEDVKLREKYYLYRLIATSKNVWLYAVNDLENDIEPGAFWEELNLYSKQKSSYTDNFQISYKNLYESILTNIDAKNYADKNRLNDKNFYYFPSDIKKRINISHSSYIKLKYAPFEYYLEKLIQGKRLELDFKNKINPLVLGNIVHSVFNAVFKQIAKRYFEPSEKMLFNKHIHSEKALQHVIMNLSKYKYYRAYNESDIYFDTFVKLFIKDSVEHFITLIYSIAKEYKRVKYIPENDFEKKIKVYHDISGIDVIVTGISDLRIETPKENFIIDFKTSNQSSYNLIKDQLLFYENLYYENSPKNILSAFYFVFDQKLYWSAKKKTPFTQLLSDLINELLLGYFVRERITYYNDTDITRADKMKKGTK